MLAACLRLAGPAVRQVGGTVGRLAPLSFSAVRRTIDVDRRVLDIPVQYGEERQVWVESLATKELSLSTILPLHPEVWAVYPRIDIIHANLQWQARYNVVNYNHVKVSVACWNGRLDPLCRTRER
jgi:hypothetical protein